jgi:hypothetical protein
MKFYPILLALLSLTICEEAFTDGSTIAIESSYKKGVFIAASGRECLGMHEGACGRIDGLVLAKGAPGTTLDARISKQRNIQWTLVKKRNYYCFVSTIFKSFLHFDGTDCLAQTEDNVKCGTFNLHRLRQMTCSRTYGWTVVPYNGSYAFKSVAYKDVYLYFSGVPCKKIFGMSRFMRRCGEFTGRVFQTELSAAPQNFVRWTLFTPHTVALIARPRH